MKHKQITFKPYSMEQLSLWPPSLEELIPEQHLVRVVNQVVDELDIEPLLAKYKGGGTSSYHPRMMLKSDRVCLYPEDLFVAEDREGIMGKHWVYVVEWRPSPGLSHDQQLSL